jgi:hypothetical protein
MEVEGDILEAMDRGKTHDNLWGLTIKKGKTHQEDLGTIDIVDMLRYLQD